MLIQNAIKITENHPEEFFLVSAHRHDFKTYTFKDGSSISVDGGDSYIKRGGTPVKSILKSTGTGASYYLGGYATKWMEWCVDDKEPLYAIKEKLLWGTYGKDGKSPLKYVLLKNCETEHLEMILKQPKLGKLYSKVILSILKDRLPKLNRKEVFEEVDKSNKRMSKNKKTK